MLLSFANIAFSALLRLLARRRGSGFAKDVELLVLRHQLAVLNRSRGGTWTAPDLARAKKLVAQSGTAGTRVTAWWPDVGGGIVPNGRYFVSLLRRLGYRASLRVVSIDAYNRVRGDPNSQGQAGPSTWTADYAAPSNFIDVTLSCRSLTSGFNNAHFCEPRIDREIDRALALQQTDDAKANALWSHIDRQITDEAPWVPLFTQQALDFVSSRVGNYQINVQMGGLRDQMWVR